MIANCVLIPDTPKLRQMDVSFALQVVLNILSPPAKVSGGSQNNSSTKSAMHHLSISEHGRCSSMSNSHKSYIKYQGNELLITTAYLGIYLYQIPGQWTPYNHSLSRYRFYSIAIHSFPLTNIKNNKCKKKPI